jgi:hypothetical protein
MLDLSKELKENMAVSRDRVSCMVDAILDSIVRFDHQFASSPHSWAVFFLAVAWLALRCRFLLYEET